MPATPPGDFLWTDDAACRAMLFDVDGDLNAEAIGAFFVEAGRVIDPEIQSMCVACPVRRECLAHSYTGFDGKPMPAGYFAGFSYGQRSSTEYETLARTVEVESSRHRFTSDGPSRAPFGKQQLRTQPGR